jgi:hypothetical protein
MKGLTSLQRRTGKNPPTQKTQQVFHIKSIFDEIELIMEINTNSKTSHV